MKHFKLEDFLDRKIPVYILLLIFLFGICAMVSFGWAVLHVTISKYDELASNRLGPFGEALTTIAKFPSLVKQSLIQVRGAGPQVIEDNFPDLDGFNKSGKVQVAVLEDKGYLLLPVFDRKKGQSIAQLIRIADQQILREWVPDLDALKNISNSEIIKSGYEILHPLLLKDGGILFKDTDGVIVKLDSSSNIEWFIDGIFHHSTEQDKEGNIWVCGEMDPPDSIIYNFVDDAIVKISPAGKVLYKKSVAQVFDENGYHELLWGGLKHSRDPIHLNDIQPVLSDSKYWKKGDLMLSIRSLSTIALYRPSTNKIVWLKTGPWMLQHDVDIISDYQISVFGSHFFNVTETSELIDDNNYIFIYDFSNDAVTTSYKNAMESSEVFTRIEGLSEVLSNGDIFIEETTKGRLLRLSFDTVKWEFVRRLDKNHLARISWSRYLTEEQVRDVLPKLLNSYNN
jgi:hypothetical protein